MSLYFCGLECERAYETEGEEIHNFGELGSAQGDSRFTVWVTDDLNVKKMKECNYCKSLLTEGIEA